MCYSNFAGAKWPSARWQSGVPGTEKDIRQSIRPDIPMSPKASSVSDEADTLDRSHLHGLRGAGEHSFSVPGTPLCQRAEGHFAPAKFECIIFMKQAGTAFLCNHCLFSSKPHLKTSLFSIFAESVFLYFFARFLISSKALTSPRKVISGPFTGFSQCTALRIIFWISLL